MPVGMAGRPGAPGRVAGAAGREVAAGAAAAGRTAEGCVPCAGCAGAGRTVGDGVAGCPEGAAGRIGVGAGAVGAAGFAAGALAGVGVATGVTGAAGLCAGATAGFAATGAAGFAIVGGATTAAGGAAAGLIRAAFAAASFVSFSAFAAASALASSSAWPSRCLRTFSATSTGMELECVFFSVTPYPARRSMIALAFTSSSRASSLIRTWFASLRNLPLPPDPRRSSLSQAQPLPQFFPPDCLPAFRPQLHCSRGPRLPPILCSPPQAPLPQ